jgi:iron complex outermembrane receptor protein
MKHFLRLLCAIIWFFCFSVFPASAQSETEGGEEAGSGESSAAESPAMESPAYTLPSVSVTGEFDAASQTPAVPASTPYGTQFNVVTEEQIKEQGSLDFLDTLRNVPGVVYSKHNLIGTTTSTSLYIRGRGYTHPSLETTTYFDGVPRYGLVYGQSMADSIPVFATGSVEVYKYPQPSRFGAGYALVNVVPKYMAEQGMEFEGGFSGGSFLTFAENASFGLRRGRFDVFAAQSWVSTDGHVVHSGAYQQSYYLNLGLWINAFWDIRLLGNFVDSETEMPPKRGQDKADILSTFKTDTGFSTITLNNAYDKALGFVKLYFNNTDFRWLDESRMNPGDWSRQLLSAFGIKARETFSFWKGNELVTGMDIDLTRTVNEDHNTTSNSVITDFPNTALYTPFLAMSQYLNLGEKAYLIPSAGLRAYFHDLWANKASPQAGLVLGYGNTELNLSYALGVVYPAPANIQSLVNSGSLNASDLKNSKPEIVHHYEAALGYFRPGLFRIGASYFYDDGRDRIIFPGGSLIPDNASLASYFRINGIEASGSLSLEKNLLVLEKLVFFTGGTWLVDIKAKGDSGEEVNKVPYTPTFSMSAGFKWTFMKNFHLSGDYQYLCDIYEGVAWRADFFTELQEDAKLDDIHLINLRLSYGFDYTRWHIESAELFVSINNLLNRKYEYYVGYEMPGTSFTIGGSFKLK